MVHLCCSLLSTVSYSLCCCYCSAFAFGSSHLQLLREHHSGCWSWILLGYSQSNHSHYCQDHLHLQADCFYSTCTSVVSIWNRHMDPCCHNWCCSYVAKESVKGELSCFCRHFQHLGLKTIMLLDARRLWSEFAEGRQLCSKIHHHKFDCKDQGLQMRKVALKRGCLYLKLKG